MRPAPPRAHHARRAQLELPHPRSAGDLTARDVSLADVSERRGVSNLTYFQSPDSLAAHARLSLLETTADGRVFRVEADPAACDP